MWIQLPSPGATGRRAAHPSLGAVPGQVSAPVSPDRDCSRRGWRRLSQNCVRSQVDIISSIQSRVLILLLRRAPAKPKLFQLKVSIGIWCQKLWNCISLLLFQTRDAVPASQHAGSDSSTVDSFKLRLWLGGLCQACEMQCHYISLPRFGESAHSSC